MGEKRNLYRILVEKHKERYQLEEDFGIVGKKIWKLIFKKKNKMASIGFM
jgi:hypothetical protein